jgi:hypothetical protein
MQSGFKLYLLAVSDCTQCDQGSMTFDTDRGRIRQPIARTAFRVRREARGRKLVRGSECSRGDSSARPTGRRRHGLSTPA